RCASYACLACRDGPAGDSSTACRSIGRVAAPNLPAREYPMAGIDSLADRLAAYLGHDQVNLVRRAYFYAEQAHDGQRRRSGEAYVTHPLAVASILADMHMDHQSLM